MIVSHDIILHNAYYQIILYSASRIIYCIVPSVYIMLYYIIVHGVSSSQLDSMCAALFHCRHIASCINNIAGMVYMSLCILYDFMILYIHVGQQMHQFIIIPLTPISFRRVLYINSRKLWLCQRAGGVYS